MIGPFARLHVVEITNQIAGPYAAKLFVDLDARGYYEALEHPVTGMHRYPGWPFRLTPGPGGHHRTPPPTLGQHNDDEVLRGLAWAPTNWPRCESNGVLGEPVLYT